MRRLRAFLRALALILWTGAIFVPWGLGLPLGLVSRRRAVGLRAQLLRAWGNGAQVIIGASITTEGTPPTGAFLLVANHLSYVDVVALASRMPCAFVAKGEVRGWPLIGWLVTAMNTVFVDRNSARSLPASLDRVDALLAAGCGVVLFPEGTSSQGVEVQRFHPSMLARAAEREIPVHYAALSYRAPSHEKPAHLSVCWWGDMTFPDHLWDLLSMSGFHATVAFGEKPIVDADRKRLADSLQASVARRFEPVLNTEEACA